MSLFSVFRRRANNQPVSGFCKKYKALRISIFVENTKQAQSKILTNELLPLIERIRTENLILTGWIEFLKNPYRISPPKLLKTDTDKPFSTKIYLNMKEYFDQFTLAEEAVL